MRVNFTYPIAPVLPVNRNRESINPHKPLFSNNATPISNSNFTIPFLGKKVPVYSISQNGEYKRFESASDAARECGLLPVGVSTCLSGKNRFAGNYSFVRAEEVETIKKDGTVSVDTEKIKEIAKSAQAARVEHENMRRKAIYSISKTGELRKFSSLAEAAETYCVLRSNISSCLSGKLKTAGGYVFVSAKEIESKNQNGVPVPDDNKISRALKNAERVFAKNQSGDKIPVYAIHKSGMYIKFDTIHEATKELETSYEGIAACLSGSKKFSGDYTFMRAEDIEIIKENGIISVNKEKIKEAMKTAEDARRASNTVRGQAIYAINQEGEVQRFDSCATASKALNILPSNISACVNGRVKNSMGYVFVPARDIETIDKNGNPCVDSSKIKKIMQQRENYFKNYKEAKNTPIYAIDAKGNYQRFNNLFEAKNECGISWQDILSCISMKQSSVLGLYFIRADRVETRDGKIDDGRCGNFSFAIRYGIDVLAKKDDGAIYIADKNKKRKFQSTEEAAKALGVPESTIRACAEKRIKSRQYGFSVIKAYEIVKTNDEGETIIEEERLKKLLETIDNNTEEKGRVEARALYAINGLQEELRFQDISEASRELGIEEETISACLNDEKSKCSGDYAFIKAEEIETESETLEPKADKEKLRIWKVYAGKHLKSTVPPDAKIKPEKQRPTRTKPLKLTEAKRRRLGKIYVITPQGKDIEFEDIKEASKKLNLSEEDIYYALKGASTEIDGFLFTCDFYG